MTVQARRYGRWCREHFDAVPAQGVPAPRATEAAEATVVAQPEADPVPTVPEQPQQS
jgi:hypothetical protein